MNYHTEQAILYLKHNKDAIEYINNSYNKNTLNCPDDFKWTFRNDIEENCPDLKTHKIDWEEIANYFLS